MLAGKAPKSKDIPPKFSHNRHLTRPSENPAYIAHFPKKPANGPLARRMKDSAFDRLGE
jgi:hypothetical protein